MVDLLWVRDHYDANRSRYIEGTEKDTAFNDWTADTISMSDFMEVLDAYDNHTLLPAYSSAEQFISFIIPTGATIKVDGVQYD